MLSRGSRSLPHCTPTAGDAEQFKPLRKPSPRHLGLGTTARGGPALPQGSVAHPPPLYNLCSEGSHGSQAAGHGAEDGARLGVPEGMVCSLHGQLGTRAAPPVGGAQAPTLSIRPAVRHAGGWGCGVQSARQGPSRPKTPAHRTLTHPANRRSDLRSLQLHARDTSCEHRRPDANHPSGLRA